MPIRRFSLFSSLPVHNEALNKEHLRWNDTVRYVQRLHNYYYAHDDGTAEMGWGLLARD